ncbi:hypothetical protein GCM10010912_11710 [Paenibacillus albidus]|uniref:Uncharacterized protein n=1 Tax=Paenibacillus albidus TaxID=2041023 RepID=A0A917FDS6_9BACL|nr:hypothetical protein GCM10010912_11710 [Paenibacillus albidus]
MAKLRLGQMIHDALFLSLRILLLRIIPYPNTPGNNQSEVQRRFNMGGYSQAGFALL